MADKRRALEVLIVEDSGTDTKRVVRELRRSGFSPRWERVETTAALREALLRRPWHLVISDSSVPRLPALHALALTKELAPHVPFIVVSSTIAVESAVEAMRLGAADYVAKDRLERLRPAAARVLRLEQPGGGIGHILTALRLKLETARGARGERRANALREALALTDQAVGQARDISIELWSVKVEPSGRLPSSRLTGSRGPRDDFAFEKLTARQREILQLIAEGHSTKEIGCRLQISPKTVETHRSQLMDRLDIHHVAGLVHYAIRAGLVPPGSE